MRALIIDDERGIRLALAHFLTGRGFEVFQAATGAEGLALAQSTLPEIIFLDQRLPDMDGEVLLHPLTSTEIGSWVVMMTAYVELDKAVQAMKNGAAYYFPKPLDLEQVSGILESLKESTILKQEVEHFRKFNGAECGNECIIGEAPHIVKNQRLISLLAQNSATPVLILGESGSGKELVAKSIHSQSGAGGPLVEINCASLSESLLESELFGHEKGAFTDARETKPGLFEVAAYGSIFFDELAEMPLSIQAKLLKVLDSGTFRRVGGIADIKSNARFMAATNRDIVDLVRKGLFREDLYYRINVLPITVPPLRSRGRDVLMLADHFVRSCCKRMGKGYVSMTAEAMSYLLKYQWPGNVRELKNVIERALILTTTREILPEHFPREITRHKPINDSANVSGRLRLLAEVEDEYIAQVLQLTGNNHSRTAKILGISRSTLLIKLKKKSLQ